MAGRGKEKPAKERQPFKARVQLRGSSRGVSDGCARSDFLF